MNRRERGISSYYECVTYFQHLLVDYFGKLSNTDYYNKKVKNDGDKKGIEVFESLIKKDFIISKIITYVSPNQTYGEDTKRWLINYGQALLKLPEIIEKYYNLDCEGLLEKSEFMKKQYLINLNLNSVNNANLTEDSKEFFVYLEDQTSFLRALVSIVTDFITIFIKIKEFSQKLMNIEESEIGNLIATLEDLLQSNEKLINDSNESKYGKNIYDSILILIQNNLCCLIYLLNSYVYILQLDMIRATSQMVSFVRVFEQIRKKIPNYESLNLYSFYSFFYSDNYNKYNLIFAVFLDKKQNCLLMESLNSFDPSVKICEYIFKRKPNEYSEKSMKRCSELGIDSNYIIICFEKRKFEESLEFEEKSLLLKAQYKSSNNKSYIESSKEFAIVKIFNIHMNENVKSILNELESINFDKKHNFFGKTKLKDCSLLISRLSKFLFLAMKYKEKDKNDDANCLEITKDFQSKFANFHVFKKI